VSRGTPTGEVTLGEHTLPVYAQRHAYLTNRLARFLGDLQASAETETDDVLGLVQERSYELLCVVIPALEKRIPEYEYRGYGSREAMDQGDYDEQADKSPTVPEIRNAFEVAIKVNGFDVFVHLKGLIDPKLVRAWLTSKLAEALSETSPSLPSANGASGSTSSGTTPPATTPNEG
jgi:hypothetical protein